MSPDAWGLIGMLIGAGITLIGYVVGVWAQKR